MGLDFDPIIMNGWDLAFSFTLEEVNQALRYFHEAHPSERITYSEPEFDDEFQLDLSLGAWEITGGSGEIIDVCIPFVDGVICGNRFSSSASPFRLDLRGFELRFSTRLAFRSVNGGLNESMLVFSDAVRETRVSSDRLDKNSEQTLPTEHLNSYLSRTVCEIVKSRLEDSRVVNEFHWLTASLDHEQSGSLEYGLSYSIQNKLGCAASLVVAYSLGRYPGRQIEIQGLPDVEPGLYAAAVSQRLFADAMVKRALINALYTLDRRCVEDRHIGIDPLVFGSTIEPSGTKEALLVTQLIDAQRSIIRSVPGLSIRLPGGDGDDVSYVTGLVCSIDQSAVVVELFVEHHLNRLFNEWMVRHTVRLHADVTVCSSSDDSTRGICISFDIHRVDDEKEDCVGVGTLFEIINSHGTDRLVHMIRDVLSSVEIPFHVGLPGGKVTFPINIYINGDVAVTGLIR